MSDAHMWIRTAVSMAQLLMQARITPNTLTALLPEFIVPTSVSNGSKS